MNCFIDSNVWLYAFIEGQNEEKARKAETLIENNEPALSTQVVNEVCVNLIRQAEFSEEEVRRLVASFYHRYPIYQLSQDVLVRASSLRERYSFSFWDGLIVSAALATGVEQLFSEDMQDGLVVDERLRIINPFDQT